MFVTVIDHYIIITPIHIRKETYYSYNCMNRFFTKIFDNTNSKQLI